MSDFNPATDHLYSVALLAVRPREGKPPKLEAEAWATPAATEDDAFNLGLERAFTLWPESEGWEAHAVRTIEIVFRFDNFPALGSLIADKEERIM